MSETADRYRRVAAGFTARVEAVPDAAWANASPCEGWTARDVVRHVVDGQRYFVGLAGGTVPDGPSVDDDPAAAWATVRDAMQAALDDPSVAGHEYESPMFGRTTLEQSVARIGVSDVLLHTWDLARATGLDDRLDPDEAVRVLAAVRTLGDAARSPRVFGPELDTAPDADDQARLLAFTGRRA